MWKKHTSSNLKSCHGIALTAFSVAVLSDLIRFSKAQDNWVGVSKTQRKEFKIYVHIVKNSFRGGLVREFLMRLVR